VLGVTDRLIDDLTGVIGNSGTPHPLLLLTDTLERVDADAVIAVVVLADGADVVLLRATGRGHRAEQSVAEQVAAGRDDLDYLRFLSWRGQVAPEPPRRPAPARASSPAASRNTEWKFGFTGSRDRSTGALHLPPARVSWDGGAVDEMDPAPMADVSATIRTFTVDHLSWSPSPPTVFAVLDFDATDDGPAGRYACALTDLYPDAVQIGDRVSMVFRRLGEADGVVNYFWKATPARVANATGA
jgi:hydroxymethylglutaryl-CoA synthase